MKSRGSFSEIACEAIEKIRKNNGSIYDVDLMMHLDFTPDSWKTWKPHFIQVFSLRPLPYTNSDGEKYNYQIVYNKKERKWEGQMIVLE